VRNKKQKEKARTVHNIIPQSKEEKLWKMGITTSKDFASQPCASPPGHRQGGCFFMDAKCWLAAGENCV